MWELGIPPDGPVCFGQLLGMCDHVSLALGMAQFPATTTMPIQPWASFLLRQVPSHIFNQCLAMLLSRACRRPSLQTLLERPVAPVSKGLAGPGLCACCLLFCCPISYVLRYLSRIAPQGLSPESLCFPLPLYPKFIASGLLRHPRYANLDCKYVRDLLTATASQGWIFLMIYLLCYDQGHSLGVGGLLL